MRSRDQDNMGLDEPLCEDCWNEQKNHGTVSSLRYKINTLERENATLRNENQTLGRNVNTLGLQLAETRRKQRENDRWATCEQVRRSIECMYTNNRERSLALTKLDECELWLERCETKKATSPAADAIQDAV